MAFVDISTFSSLCPAIFLVVVGPWLITSLNSSPLVTFIFILLQPPIHWPYSRHCHYQEPKAHHHPNFRGLLLNHFFLFPAHYCQPSDYQHLLVFKMSLETVSHCFNGLFFAPSPPDLHSPLRFHGKPLLLTCPYINFLTPLLLL